MKNRTRQPLETPQKFDEMIDAVFSYDPSSDTSMTRPIFFRHLQEHFGTTFRFTNMFKKRFQDHLDSKGLRREKTRGDVIYFGYTPIQDMK